MTMQTTEQLRENARFLGLAAVTLAAGFLILAAARRMAGEAFGQRALYFAFVALVVTVAIGVSAVCVRMARSQRQKRALDRVLQYCGYCGPLVVLLFGLYGMRETLYHAQWSIIDPNGARPSSMRFVAGSLVTAIVIALIVRYRPLRNLNTFWVIGLLGVFALGLLNVDLGYDSSHFGAYLGPASETALGAVPLVDVLSQYGLNFLALAAWLKVMPWSAFSASLFVSALNSIYYFVIALICVRMARNKPLAALLAAFLILFLTSAALYNLAYTPSAGAMRYLPPFLVLLALSYLRSDSSFSYSLLTAIALASLWSLESLIFSAGICSVYIICEARRATPFGWATSIKQHGRLLLALTVPHVVLMTLYLLTIGGFPRYDIYFELVAANMGSAGWVFSRDPGVRTWLIFAFGYGIALAHAFFRCWKRDDEPRATGNYYSVIAAIAVLGVAEFSYYAGRSVTPALTFLAFPLIMLFVLLVDRLAYAVRRQEPGMNRHCWPNALAAVLTIVACGGVLADRFFREPYVLRSNASMLRNCLSTSDAAGACLTVVQAISKRLKQPAAFVLADGTPTDREPGTWQLVPTKETTEQTISAYLLARKWMPDESRLFIFIPDPSAVLFALRKRSALGLSHPMVDAQSSWLRNIAQRAADEAAEGKIIFVGNLEQLAPEMREIHARLAARWALQKVDGRGGVNAMRLQMKP
jgi:hypothetical protein